MGTNYYVQTPPCENACKHCSASESIHLGKSSGGWRFSFQADADWAPDTAFADWMKLALNGQIVDEYGRPHTIADLLSLIHDKRELRSHMKPQPDLGMHRVYDDWFVSDGHEFSTREFS
jgi:hypothetical protein